MGQCASSVSPSAIPPPCDPLSPPALIEPTERDRVRGRSMSNARSIVAGSLAGPRVTSLVLVTTPPDAESISISCGSLQLHMVEHNGYDKWSISANQVARLLQALLDWDAAFAAQMVLCAAELSSPAKAAEKQVSWAGFSRTSSQSAAPMKQCGGVMVVHLPPNADDFPSLSSPLHALCLHTTSWQAPALRTAPVPAIFVQHQLISALSPALSIPNKLPHDSSSSMLPGIGSQGLAVLPPAPMVAGLSARLLRLLSTMDALPSMVTLCSGDGKNILYQNASSLEYTGSPAARAATACLGREAGKPQTSSSFLSDLLQLQPELVGEVLERVGLGADIWSQVVRVPESLASETPHTLPLPRQASITLARKGPLFSTVASASMNRAMGLLMVSPAASVSFAAIQRDRLSRQTPLGAGHPRPSRSLGPSPGPGPRPGPRVMFE
ncbi:hypothetical protein QJQ45_026764, partial [Haematococcus lacustris]